MTPGAFLTVTRSNSAVIASWPAPVESWVRHATTNLVAGGSVWTGIPSPCQTNGANLQLTEP